jgi:FkbM family methyltransferase
MEKDLIYDIGANDGTDTVYYLSKGFRVVAIEANPILCSNLKQKFQSQISSGSLALLDLGISDVPGEAPFWVSELFSEWSSFKREVAGREGTAHHSVMVRTTTLADVFDQYGVPFYLKIDIDGLDHLCLSAIDPADAPRYVSVEMNHGDGDNDINTLKNKGYKQFKIISQVTRANPIILLSWLSHGATPRNRIRIQHYDRLFRGKTKDGQWAFPQNSSGAFGEDTPGRWLSYSQCLSAWKQLHAMDAFFLHGGSAEWFDVHARFAAPGES